jgi:hypothetical protein
LGGGEGPHQRGSKPGFGGFWWVLAGFGGLWRALAGFGGLYRALSGFIGFYRVLSGFIRFYPVLSGFILPLFIEPPQLAATAALLLFPAMATFRYKQASTISFCFPAKGISSIVEGSLVPADVARKKVMWHEILLEIVRFAVQLEGWHAT